MPYTPNVVAQATQANDVALVGAVHKDLGRKRWQHFALSTTGISSEGA